MDTQAQIDYQDYMRPFRQFVGTLTGQGSDQTLVTTDGYAANTPGAGYQIIGPNGIAIRIPGVTDTQQQAQRAGGWNVWLMLGLAYLVLK